MLIKIWLDLFFVAYPLIFHGKREVNPLTFKTNR